MTIIVPAPIPPKPVQKYRRVSTTPCPDYAEAADTKAELVKKHRREKVRVKIRFRRKRNAFDVVVQERIKRDDTEDAAAA